MPKAACFDYHARKGWKWLPGASVWLDVVNERVTR
jgi:hypothetical protein